MPLLPVLIGGSSGTKNPWRPLIIVSSLAVSMVGFTLLLRTGASQIDTEIVLRYISGGIITLMGFFMLWPSLWEKLSFKLKFHKSEELVGKTGKKEGIFGAIILGVSLGPVFSTCSPTYGLILATVLPQSYTNALINLTFFAIGVMIPLLIIGYGGRKIAQKFKGASNPQGWFKRGLGILLIIAGIIFISGYYKKIESYLLEHGFFVESAVELETELTQKYFKQ
ncbi:sulfite exporter TauE/SafE family protein [Candidatus Peregrinibacteria bacterium]|nr:sulfite exporter TauE/SafE family protein [Candidatus Peregrinibacteria bacterium]